MHNATIRTAAALALATLTGQTGAEGQSDYQQARQRLIERIQRGDSRARLELRVLERPTGRLDLREQRRHNLADRMEHRRAQAALALA